MKTRFGKISLTVLFTTVILLLLANLFLQPITATPIDTRATDTGLSARMESRGAPGNVWFVDGNRVSNGGGTSWDDACNSLVTAMALSHDDIANSANRNWASRNTIYVKGDSITENITALAQKTDIIGVGSFNANTKASLIGTIIVPATTSYLGCRFYNMMFQDDDAGGILVNVDGQWGLQFIDCSFLVEATDTVGLQATSANFLQVKNCWFGAISGAGTGFSTACIVVADDDPMYNVTIDGNYFQGEVGIDWNETTVKNINIINNQFSVQAMWLDTDDLAGVQVYNNFGTTAVSEADNTGSDFNVLYGGNNVICGTGGPILLPAY